MVGMTSDSTARETLRLPAAEVPDPASAPALRWAVISPGGIAGKFTHSLHAATASRVVAVASRSADRAAAFAAEHGIDTSYGSVSEMLAAGGFDVVYIASPHAQHVDLAREVLRAGFPALVEKAFTLNAEQARELMDLARERSLFLMEAMWSRFLPQYAVLRGVIASGMLGEVVSVRASHGQSFLFDPAHRLFDPELGGGALLDLGVYPISLAQMVLGDLADLQVLGSLTATGVDETLGLLARGSAPVGRSEDSAESSTDSAGAGTGSADAGAGSPAGSPGIAILETTLRARSLNDATVVGTAGRAHLRETFYAPTSLHIELEDGRSAAVEHPGDPELAMAFEAAETARCIAAGALESPLMTWADTLSVLETMDEVRARLGITYPSEQEHQS